MVKILSLDGKSVLVLLDQGDKVTACFNKTFRVEEPLMKTNWTTMRRAILGLCVEYFK